MVMLSGIPFAFFLMRCSFGPGFQIGKSVPGEDRVMINSCMLIDDDNPDMSGSELLDTLHSKKLFHIEAASGSACLIFLAKPFAPDKLIGCIGKVARSL